MLSFPKRKYLVGLVAIVACQSLAAVNVSAQAPAAAAPAAAAPAAAPPQRGPVLPGKEIYTNACSGCHGTDLSGGRAPSLFGEAFLSGMSDEHIATTIQKGNNDYGMPSFKGVLSDEQTHQLIVYLRLTAGTMKAQPPFVPSPHGQIVKTKKQTFRAEVVASGLETPWGEVFLPDGRLLVTERSGRLRIIQNGKLLSDPVKGTPKVWERQDAGMLDVAIGPNFKKDGWVYLSYTDSDPSWVAPAPKPGDNPNRPPSPPSMTVLIRGHISAKNEWVDSHELFRAPYSLYTPSGAHYGSRFLFDGKGHLFYSLGERGEFTNAQNLSNPLGKIHRINEDGSTPTDNPFYNTPGADKTIWSYGHRNPQGLTWDPVTGQLWESEHGPTGGDEINIIEKGHNYGWGVATMGAQTGVTKQHAPGMDDPIVYYSPTIAPSGINFYSGNKYPGWKNSLFVAALAGQQLKRLEVKDRKVVSQEVIFIQFGRTRQVITGPDGLLYILLQNPTGGNTGVNLATSTPGMVVRLVPVK